jgi:Transglutaminase-like superfamily
MPVNRARQPPGMRSRARTGPTRSAHRRSQPPITGEVDITRRRFIATLLAAGLLIPVGTGAGRTSATTRQLIVLMNTLAAEIELLAARTMPAGWQLLHACLYYALAGQYFLARRGILTRLKGGAVLYYPDTPLQHRIQPHVWLETDAHVIDGSALPRWGYIAVFPLQQVARDPGEVIPGETRLLILEQRDDPQFLDYVAGHRARFERALRGAEPGHE